MTFRKVSCYGQLGGIFRGQPVFFTFFSDRVIQLFILGHACANLMAFGGSNPALLLQFAPGNIIFFGANQAEYVGLAPVFFGFAGLKVNEVTELRRQVRTFIAGEVAAGTFDPDRPGHGDSHDHAFSRRVGAKGWIGMTWPKKYGGHERSFLERHVVTEEFRVANAPVRLHFVAERLNVDLNINYYDPIAASESELIIQLRAQIDPAVVERIRSESGELAPETLLQLVRPTG